MGDAYFMLYFLWSTFEWILLYRYISIDCNHRVWYPIAVHSFWDVVESIKMWQWSKSWATKYLKSKVTSDLWPIQPIETKIWEQAMDKRFGRCTWMRRQSCRWDWQTVWPMHICTLSMICRVNADNDTMPVATPMTSRERESTIRRRKSSMASRQWMRPLRAWIDSIHRNIDSAGSWSAVRWGRFTWVTKRMHFEW